MGANPKIKIAIVDDEESFLNLFSSILSREPNFEIKTYAGAKTALLEIPLHLPDIVLLDVKMPEMNGFEVFEHLKRDCAAKMPKVIFLTSLGETIGGTKVDEHFALSIGASGYLNKNEDVDNIVEKVKKLTSGKNNEKIS